MRHQLHHTLLTGDEERSLLLAAQGGNADALEEIVLHNQRLVYRIAVRYHRFGYGGDQELTDLMQWGNIGLLSAIRKWDGRKGKFSTYATYWVKALVRRYSLIKGIPFGVSFGQSERMGHARASRVHLMMSKNREPTLFEIANEADVPLDEVMFSCDIARNVISLDQGWEESDGNLHEIIKDDTQDIENDEQLDIQGLKMGMKYLSEKERDVIAHRYAIDDNDFWTFDKLAAKYGVSRTRIQQIEKDALHKLKAYVNPVRPKFSPSH